MNQGIRKYWELNAMIISLQCLFRELKKKIDIYIGSADT